MIDKDKLLADLRYSSQWNEPCPEWVYRKIQAMEGVEPEVTAEMVDSYVKPRCLRVITEELFVELTTGKYLPPRLQPTQPEILRCKDCDWWTKQRNSAQGRCALFGMYPTGAWYCANARKRGKKKCG